MKNTKHSFGWYTVKRLTQKNKTKRIIIAVMAILYFLSVVLFALIGGK